MMINDKELNKLLNALESIEEEKPDFYDELKQAGWNILHENPGIDCGDWISMLIEQYPAEVVDAIGSHPAETYASLEDMWENTYYEDTETGECHSFKEWAEYFAIDRSVELYDLLVEAKREIRRFKALKNSEIIKPLHHTTKYMKTHPMHQIEDISVDHTRNKSKLQHKQNK